METRYRSFRALFFLAVCALFPALSFAQSPDVPVTSADQIWEGAGPGARAGLWLDQGALSTGDNRRDLVIGAPGGAGVFGTVHIVYGGPVRTGVLNLSSSDAVITGAAAGDLFGTSTAVGNILSTEGTDPKNLVVGAPNASSGRGIVYLFAGPFGTAASLTTGDAVYRIVGATGDQLGSMLATADLDNDGRREIIIGAPGNNRVYVVKGAASLSGTLDLSVSPAAMTITQTGIGRVLTAGDVTGDNLQDVIIGAPSANTVYLYAGLNGALPAAPAAVFTGIDAGDEAGASLRLGDFDGDGKRDLLIGAPGGDGPANDRNLPGEVYLLWGGAPLASRNLSLADVTFYGVPGERLGAQLAAGDVNRDLPNDAVMLAETGASGTGVLYIYYGRSRTSIGTDLGDGRRRVDFAIGQFTRRIVGAPSEGAIVSAQVFEVTGEGARDVIVGIPGALSGAGRVFFTLSPKMRISPNPISLTVKKGATGTTSFQVINAAALSITWEATVNQGWVTLSPTAGSSVDSAPGTVNISVATAGLPGGTHTATITVRSTSNDLFMALPVTLTVRVTETLIALDTPAAGSTVTQPFNIAGWALDRSATSNAGVDAVHAWAFPTDGSSPVFVGAASLGGSRTDVGGIFGAQFNNSGFNLQATGLTPKTYDIAVYARTTATQTFDAVKVSRVTVGSSAVISIDTPRDEAFVDNRFYMAGWAIDPAAPSGTGVDTIHVWAFPEAGSPVFLGAGIYGTARSDVGAYYGSRFTNSGFHMHVNDLNPGRYTVSVYARSTATGTFSIIKNVRVTVMASARMALDSPAHGATVAGSFQVGGWAIDIAAPTGTGVDAIHVWATPVNGGAAIFVGQAAYGSARGDVGALFGSRFTNSGFNLTGTLPAGQYVLSVYARSTVAGSFNNLRTATITVQ